MACAFVHGLRGRVKKLLHRIRQMFCIVDERDFNEQVLCARGLVLVNFWTGWSDQCRIMSSLMRIMADLLDEQDAIVQIDWDQHRGLAQKLEVFGVPTLLIYISGCERARYSGTMNKQDLIRGIIQTKHRHF